jgi:hypothetical protein
MNDFVLSNTQPGMQAKVLVISDDHDSARIWCHILNEKNIDATLLGSPEEAPAGWSASRPGCPGS